MNNFILKIALLLLCIGGILIGIYLAALAFTELSRPWLNSFVFVGGLILAGSCLTYILIRIQRHFVK
jgi:hypothetical protein